MRLMLRRGWLEVGPASGALDDHQNIGRMR
jgi:hypothetical protein